MLRRHVVEALAAGAGALLVTLVMAAPVVRAPSERIFGAEIVGRHHDPFTVMQQFARPWSLGLYSQPITDLTGAAIAGVTGPVAAYNWLVLLSFPLSAAAAFLLARHLALAPGGALLAALLFAFSPFHLAHAAYHPHVAQTQWLALYFLALWRCMDEATWLTVTCLGAATAAVTLSNFYGGLIAAVLTPVAVGAYWMAHGRSAARGARHLLVTIGALAALAIAGLAFVAWRAPQLVDDRAAFAFPRDDLYSYAAKWWSYMVPAVAHPVLGTAAQRLWTAARVSDGLLEQQVSLGWGVVALGFIAIGAWFNAFRRRHGSRALQATPVLAAVALAALISSLSPERTIFGVTVYRPSALLYLGVPMFRAYARFGAVVQLMAALLAGIGATHLLARRTRPSQLIAAALVVLACAEYAVWPPALSRDVLPTAAHRWVMQQTPELRALDCDPLTPASSSIVWLTRGRIALADETIHDCAEPQLAGKLRAAGFTHLLVRDSWQRQWLRERGDADGVHGLVRFADADVFVIGPGEIVYAQSIAGFWPREHGAGTTWRWMSADASWTIVSPAPQARVMLAIELRAFDAGRTLALRMDEASEQTLRVQPDLQEYRIGPFALSAGSHRLTFHAAARPTIAGDVIGNGDRRALSISAGRWRWEVE